MTDNKQNSITPVRSFLVSIALLVAVGTGLAVMTACSTTEGFGEDVKNLGGNIEDSAERNK